MKRVFFAITIVSSLVCFGQVTFGNTYSNNVSSVLFKNKVYDMENKNKDIQGSAYLYEDFADASIKDVEGTPKVRYNALKDDMEVKQENQVYVIPREDNFSTIKIIGSGDVIKLEKFEYKGQPYEGYLFVVYESSDFTIFKKEKVEFKDYEKPRNSYTEETPARFITQKNEFFIKTADGKISELPKNKKKLIELLPKYQSKIEIFLKNNKVDFGNDKDLKKLFSSL
ncbi:hypothetical protein D3C87_363430 [compost metagenome]